MVKSIAVINALLVDIKTINNTLLIGLQNAGFNTELQFGPEQEYNLKSLLDGIDTLVIQLLTITANRNQFLQRTSFSEPGRAERQVPGRWSATRQTLSIPQVFHR